MKAPFSPYLTQIADGLKQVVKQLQQSYPYVSLLASDSQGFSIRVTQHAQTASDPMFCERGFVVRVYQDGQYSEVSFNKFDASKPQETVAWIQKQLEAQKQLLNLTHTNGYSTPMIEEEETVLFAEKETDSLPEEADLSKLICLLKGISDQGMKEAPDAVECVTNAQSTHVNKLFLSGKKDMRQSYVYSEGMVAVIASKGQETKLSYDGVSGCVGPKLFDSLKDKVSECAKTAEEVLDAQQIVPGEYDVITSPDVTGLIAHEAFGHGVEMDMFVKDRALGKHYIGKRVGSDKVTMHEGARCAEDVTSYFFDDEGILAGDVTEIKNGILETGICDTLSALRLGIQPTGNGKRQNFEHKVYTRMTNTLFDSGTDSLEDMISSIQHGYLLVGMQSGMEDPKHWGIQCMVDRGLEIQDGKLTGKMVSPVILTGYVPDLLGSISMVSKDRNVYGNGMCGKGHKEWVKVADGGPYLKAKARLG